MNGEDVVGHQTMVDCLSVIRTWMVNVLCVCVCVLNCMRVKDVSIGSRIDDGRVVLCIQRRAVNTREWCNGTIVVVYCFEKEMRGTSKR